MNELKMKIAGMSCGHCVGAVNRALAQLPGVQVDEVAIGSAHVHFEPMAVTPAEIASAVEDAGYAVVDRT